MIVIGHGSLSVAWIVFGITLSGCARENRPAPASSGDAALSDSQTAASDTSKGVDKIQRDRQQMAVVETVPERPRILSNSPIDRMPEGSRYRAALAAIDRDQMDFAVETQQQLSQHPTYGVLGDAIETLLLARDGQFEEAMQRAQQVSTVAVMQPESYMLAADVFRLQGRWNDAIGCLSQAAALNPGLTRAQRWLGILYYDVGAMQRATKHLRMAADGDPKEIGSLNLSSRIYSEYENYTEAEIDCRRALERRPAEPLATELLLRLADAQRHLRRFDDAISTLEKCADGPAVWAARALVWEAMGKTDQAMTACQTVLENDENDRIANLVSGRILLSQRNASTAVERLQRAVAVAPYNHEARFLLGRALLLKGESEAGKAEIERSTELKELFLEMARLHLEAVDRPQDVEVRMRLAELTEQYGRPQLAAMWYRAVLSMQPSNHLAQAALQRLHLEQ